jgi:hypothetical protein
VSVFEDPYQWQRHVANHEARHATAHYFFEQPILEIDINHPEHGIAGHVKPAPTEDHIPEDLVGHAAIMRWIDETNLRKWLMDAVCCRVGGRTFTEWEGADCLKDRDNVRLLCPNGFDPGRWELLVEEIAEGLLRNPAFQYACRDLAGELLRDHRHEPMQGEKAFGFIRASLADYRAGGTQSWAFPA